MKYIKNILSKLDALIDDAFCYEYHGDLSKHRQHSTRYDDLCK